MGITPQEALDLFNSDDLIGIGMAANEVRRTKTDPRVATYQIDRNINYTNFCTEYCSFCAFYRPLGAKDGYILPLEAIYEKIEEMLDAGRDGRAAAGRTASGSADRVLRKHAALDPRALPAGAPALLFGAGDYLHRGSFRAFDSRDDRAAARCGAGIRFPAAARKFWTMKCARRISRLKCKSDEWETVHREAHKLGMRTTATMMFGCGEEYRHRVNHLERCGEFRKRRGGFTAFIPWIFAPENTPLGKKVPETTAFDYLKTLAISRLYLDNIDHIQSSWLTPGIKVCQVGLQFGADDVGSILIEENVVYAAGVRNRTNEEELRRIISDAGYMPAQRDTLYMSYVLKEKFPPLGG